jgi:hypothetical protein
MSGIIEFAKGLFGGKKGGIVRPSREIIPFTELGVTTGLGAVQQRLGTLPLGADLKSAPVNDTRLRGGKNRQLTTNIDARRETKGIEPFPVDVNAEHGPYKWGDDESVGGGLGPSTKRFLDQFGYLGQWANTEATKLYGPFNPAAISDYTAKLMRGDWTIAFARDIWVSAMHAVPWHFEGGDPEIRGFLEEAMLPNIGQWIEACLLALDFGRVDIEMVWDLADVAYKWTDGDTLATVEREAEKRDAYVIAQLRDLDPMLCSLQVDRYGDFAGIIYQGRGGLMTSEVVMHVVNEMLFGNLNGQSLMARAYSPWWWGNCLALSLNRYLQNKGDPPLIATAPGLAETDGKGNVQEPIKVMGIAAANIRGGGSFTIPSDYDPDSKQPLYTIKALEIAERAQEFLPWWDRLEAAKRMAYLIPGGIGSSPSEGSGGFGKGKVDQEVIDHLMDRRKKMCVLAPINAGPVPRMCYANFGRNVKSRDIPTLTAGDMSYHAKQVFSELIRSGLTLEGILPDGRRAKVAEMIDQMKLLKTCNIPTMDARLIPTAIDPALMAGPGGQDPTAITKGGKAEDAIQSEGAKGAAAGGAAGSAVGFPSQATAGSGAAQRKGVGGGSVRSKYPHAGRPPSIAPNPKDVPAPSRPGYGAPPMARGEPVGDDAEAYLSEIDAGLRRIDEAIYEAEKHAEAERLALQAAIRAEMKRGIARAKTTGGRLSASNRGLGAAVGKKVHDILEAGIMGNLYDQADIDAGKLGFGRYDDSPLAAAHAEVYKAAHETLDALGFPSPGKNAGVRIVKDIARDAYSNGYGVMVREARRVEEAVDRMVIQEDPVSKAEKTADGWALPSRDFEASTVHHVRATGRRVFSWPGAAGKAEKWIVGLGEPSEAEIVDKAPTGQVAGEAWTMPTTQDLDDQFYKLTVVDRRPETSWKTLGLNFGSPEMYIPARSSILPALIVAVAERRKKLLEAAKTRQKTLDEMNAADD